MRVLYESQLFDVTTPSGARGPGHAIFQVLNQSDVELRLLGPPAAPPWWLELLARKAYRRLTRRRYLRFPLSQASRLSARLNAEVDAWKPDVVFTMFPPALSGYGSRANSRRAPTVYRVDATYQAMQREYPEYGYSRFMVGLASRLQARSCRASTLLVTHREWCRECLVQEMGVPEDRIRVFANVAGLPPDVLPDEVNVTPRRSGDQVPLRLLFVGGDRHRKGLDLALEVVQRLNEVGRPARLTVCGTEDEDRPHTRFVGTFDQSVPAELQAYLQLYRDSDLLLHPTRFDTWAMVTSEAAAFAVPTVTNAVAGMSSSVLDGETGLVLPKGSDARAYVAAIVRQLDEPELAVRLRRGARRRYERELSWSRFGDQLLRTLREAVQIHRSESCI